MPARPSRTTPARVQLLVVLPSAADVTDKSGRSERASGRRRAAPADPDKVTPAVGSVFALDVTDSTKFAESSASSLVMGEWSSASLNASGCTGAGSNCGDHLGATYGVSR